MPKLDGVLETAIHTEDRLVRGPATRVCSGLSRSIATTVDCLSSSRAPQRPIAASRFARSRHTFWSLQRRDYGRCIKGYKPFTGLRARQSRITHDLIHRGPQAQNTL
jgi:hypothetical protein